MLWFLIIIGVVLFAWLLWAIANYDEVFESKDDKDE